MINNETDKVKQKLGKALVETMRKYKKKRKSVLENDSQEKVQEENSDSCSDSPVMKQELPPVKIKRASKSRVDLKLKDKLKNDRVIKVVPFGLN